jgi:predicted amidohydrolase YtcJ
VFLWSVDGHTAWANTRALALAKITDQTADPPDGRSDRNAQTAVAIGSLQEGAADLVAAVIPPITPAQREAGLRLALEVLNRYGITAIQDAAAYADDLKAYLVLDSRGELSLRVVAAIWWERSLGLQRIDRIKRLRAEYSTGRIDAGTAITLHISSWSIVRTCRAFVS